MGAFFAASTIKPKLSPPPDLKKKFQERGNGLKIEAR
jgi:hypothetical protein